MEKMNLEEYKKWGHLMGRSFMHPRYNIVFTVTNMWINEDKKIMAGGYMMGTFHKPETVVKRKWRSDIVEPEKTWDSAWTEGFPVEQFAELEEIK